MGKTPYIILNRIHLYGQSRISLYFRYHRGIIDILKGIPGTRYLAENHLWHLEESPENVRLLTQSLSPIARLIWRIPNPGQRHTQSLKKTAKRPSKKRNLAPEIQNLLEAFRLELSAHRYAASTVHTYTHMIADILHFHHPKPISQLNNAQIQSYIKQELLPKQSAISTHRQVISAVKAFVKFAPQCPIDPDLLRYPKKESKLPTVLSTEEIIDLICVTQNLKHRAITALIYAAGLRISELLHLKLKDLDIDRRQIHIRQSKGRKDRQVMLAESFLPLLQNYLASYHPIYYFAEGKPGIRYSAASIRAFLKRNCRKAGIRKNVSPHTLRHSYATHLMENGVDIRYIQELLGHSRPETTMIYTHVSRHDLLSIKSPLDLAAQRLFSPSSKTNKPNLNLLLSHNLHGTNQTE